MKIIKLKTLIPKERVKYELPSDRLKIQTMIRETQMKLLQQKVRKRKVVMVG